MKTLTTTTATPTRIATGHYQIASSSQDRSYDLTYNYELKRWQCNCPDVRHNGNNNCKHRRRLVQWLREQQEASRVQAEATAIAEEQAQPSALEIEIAMLKTIVQDQQKAIEQLQEQIEHLDQRLRGHANTLIETRCTVDALRETNTVSAIQELTKVVAEAAKKIKAPQAPREPKPKVLSQEEIDRLEWEAYEKDPKAWHAKRKAAIATQNAAADAQKRAEAPLNNRNEGFSLLRK